MRTGADYRRALEDGRKIWMLGVGEIEDVATHPLTKGMVDSYALWYDRHVDPKWQDLLLTPASGGARKLVAYEIPQSPDDLRRLGRAVSAVAFTTGGNMTHTPGYGALIALGLLDTLKAMNFSPAEISNCTAYRNEIANTGRFLTFSAGGAPIGFRFRKDEADRAALKVVNEADAGVVVSGKVSMHTSSPFAEDVFVAGGTKRKPDDQNFLWFIIPVAAPGVRIITRKPAARHDESFVAPMSYRFDELDAQLWLEDVFIPYERVFTAETPLGFGKTTGADGKQRNSNLAAWLFWHQHYCWLAKIEFTLGLALAASDAMGFKNNPPAVEHLLDMVIDVQTARSCALASEADPDMSDGGFLMPGQIHVASASLHTLAARQRMTETARRLPGSSLVVAPARSDFADPLMREGLEDAFGGGGYSAEQRAALLNLIWDHVSSGLDGRESTYEMHSNGGVGAWRMRMRSLFRDYNQLANGVLEALDLQMPQIDLSAFASPAMPRGAVPGQPVSNVAQPLGSTTEADLRAAAEWLGQPKGPV